MTLPKIRKKKEERRGKHPTTAAIDRLHQWNVLDIELYKYVVDLSKRSIDRWETIDKMERDKFMNDVFDPIKSRKIPPMELSNEVKNYFRRKCQLKWSSWDDWGICHHHSRWAIIYLNDMNSFHVDHVFSNWRHKAMCQLQNGTKIVKVSLFLIQCIPPELQNEIKNVAFSQNMYTQGAQVAI